MENNGVTRTRLVLRGQGKDRHPQARHVARIVLRRHDSDHSFDQQTQITPLRPHRFAENRRYAKRSMADLCGSFGWQAHAEQSLGSRSTSSPLGALVPCPAQAVRIADQIVARNAVRRGWLQAGTSRPLHLAENRGRMGRGSDDAAREGLKSGLGLGLGLAPSVSSLQCQDDRPCQRPQGQ